jgi:hypothetical protein
MKRAHLVFLVFIVIVVAWCIMSAEEAKTEDYTALFPSPPAGWEASQVTVKEGESMLWGIRLTLVRTYYAQSDGGKVIIALDTEELEKSSYIKTVQTASPDVLASLEKDGFHPFHYQSYDGIKFLDSEKYTAMIALEIKAGGIFEINVDTFGKNKGIVMDFLEKTDLQKIDAFMKQH